MEWVDAPWPVILQRCLTKLWDMYHEENLGRVEDKEAYEIEESHGMENTSQAINELKEKKQRLEEQAKIEVEMEKLKLKEE
ncbi:hypothetical protein ZWY2020_021953 [Hordeum vulgare]|nr:hypothetical protein ZWY2020_021953 [Hordeum vulgare]